VNGIIQLRQLLQPRIDALYSHDREVYNHTQEQMSSPEQLPHPEQKRSNPLLTLLHINTQIKLFHWQTESYAKHQAFGSYYETMDKLVDTFIETYQGKYGRIALQGGENFSIGIKGYHEKLIAPFLDEVNHYLKEVLPTTHSPNDTELCNLTDEMVAETNKLNYLLTLK
jgi:hypothetical protein